MSVPVRSSARPILSRRALLGRCVHLCLGTGVALAAGRALAGLNIWNGEYTLTRDQLQALIARRFPLTRQQGELFSVSLSDPQLGLDAAANRIAIAARLAITSLLLPQPITGQVTLGSALRYDPATLAVRLDQPDIQRITLDGLDQSDADHLQRIASAAARELLQGQALHTFRPGDLTVGPKTYTISDITVRQDDVVVRLK